MFYFMHEIYFLENQIHFSMNEIDFERKSLIEIKIQIKIVLRKKK